MKKMPKKYFLPMAGSIVLGGTAFGFAVFRLDPQSAGFWGFSALYASLFVFWAGTMFFAIFLAWNRFSRRPDSAKAEISFRQAILSALFMVFFLFLQGFRLLYLWNALLLFLFLIILEIFQMTRKYK